MLSLATCAGVLAAAPVAQAATVSGTALEVDRASQTLQIVNAHHQVMTMQTAGLSRDVRTGAKLRLRTTGRRATSVVVTGHARTVSFYARVVAAGAGRISLRLGDGRGYALSSRTRIREAHARAGQPGRKAARARRGDVVLVRSSEHASGSRTTLQVQDRGTDIGADERHVEGVVSDIDDDGFSIVVGGRALSLRADAETADVLDLCDRVAVGYHADRGTAVADVAVVTQRSGDDGCPEVPDAADDDFDSETAETEVEGTVLFIERNAGWLSVATPMGPTVYFVDDRALLDGLRPGDQAGVVFSSAADPGHIVADDVFAWS